jgi:hypothetical protein
LTSIGKQHLQASSGISNCLEIQGKATSFIEDVPEGTRFKAASELYGTISWLRALVGGVLARGSCTYDVEG